MVRGLLAPGGRGACICRLIVRGEYPQRAKRLPPTSLLGCCWGVWAREDVPVLYHASVC